MKLMKHLKAVFIAVIVAIFWVCLQSTTAWNVVFVGKLKIFQLPIHVELGV
jgi:hypothetical protein